MTRNTGEDELAEEGIAILKKSVDVDIKIGMTEVELVLIIPLYDVLLVSQERK